MKIFVYEWATGGGLVDEPGSLPASLLREGTAMVSALASDLVRVPDCHVTLLRDPRVVTLALHGCDIVDVLAGSDRDHEIERIAGESDGTILIAPEFDSILWEVAKRVHRSGGRLLSPSPEYIRISSDKQQTCDRLSAAGVPIAAGQILQPDQSLPAGFPYPAVVKPNDGAGSQDTYLVSSKIDTPPAYPWPRRLEKLMPGQAASVAILCGASGPEVLMPCKQRISDDGRMRYLGGEAPLADGLDQRARGLARQVASAMPATSGYVGIDLILGREPDGSEDVVLEVNPRLTTSYVGLRAAAVGNLAEAMINHALGQQRSIEFSTRAVEFDTEGNVSYLR